MPHNTPDSEWPYLAYASMFEMRSPLRVIQGYARMLESERRGALSEDQRKMVTEIGRSVRTALAQLERLETLGQIEYRQTCGSSAQSGVVALGEILREAVAEVTARQYEGASVDLLPPDGDDRVMGDRILLKNALSGLVRSVIIFRTQPELALSIQVVDRSDAFQRWIVMAESDDIKNALALPPDRLQPLSPPHGLNSDVPYAHLVLARHGGHAWALPDGLLGALVVLPGA